MCAPNITNNNNIGKKKLPTTCLNNFWPLSFLATVIVVSEATVCSKGDHYYCSLDFFKYFIYRIHSHTLAIVVGVVCVFMRRRRFLCQSTNGRSTKPEFNNNNKQIQIPLIDRTPIFYKSYKIYIVVIKSKVRRAQQ